MYVKKFKANNMDEALRMVKKEFGPDAIILKTSSQKGLKGILNRSGVEVTAAVSEKNLREKARVDSVFDDQQKQKFYSGSSSVISSMIDNYNGYHARDASKNKTEGGGYAKHALNKTVRQTKEINSGIKKTLDEFLNRPSKVKKKNPPPASVAQENTPTAPTTQESTPPVNVAKENTPPEKALTGHFGELERKIYDLEKRFKSFSQIEPQGTLQLSNYLRSLRISEKYIRDLIKKIVFELSPPEQEDYDLVFEFALRDMMESINIELPLFSSTDSQYPVVTLFLSETSTGQSSLVNKVGALHKGMLIIRNDAVHTNFSNQVLDLETLLSRSVPEIISYVRKATDKGQSVLIDYNVSPDDRDVKKFITGLRRGFENVEVLLSVSAIHTEEYNNKIMQTYGGVTDGSVINHLDLCLNFGSLFNLTQHHKGLPIKFYGNGEVIPNDFEAATAERLLGKIFKIR